MKIKKDKKLNAIAEKKNQQEVIDAADSACGPIDPECFDTEDSFHFFHGALDLVVKAAKKNKDIYMVDTYDAERDMSGEAYFIGTPSEIAKRLNKLPDAAPSEDEESEDE